MLQRRRTARLIKKKVGILLRSTRVQKIVVGLNNCGIKIFIYSIRAFIIQNEKNGYNLLIVLI